MDIYGIGTALRACARVCFESARGTGRTTHLINCVQDGDCIVFAHQQEAKRVKRLLRLAGKDTKVIVVPPKEPHRLRDKAAGFWLGQLYFDHGWVEQYYEEALAGAGTDITRMAGYYSKSPTAEPAALDERKWEGMHC